MCGIEYHVIFLLFTHGALEADFWNTCFYFTQCSRTKQRQKVFCGLMYPLTLLVGYQKLANGIHVRVHCISISKIAIVGDNLELTKHVF